MAYYNKYFNSPISEEDESISRLSSQFEELYNYVRGADTKFGGGVPRDPVDIARGEIADVYKTRKATKKELPLIYRTFEQGISRGSTDPDEARYAYLDIARASGGNLAEAYKKADLLGAQSLGFVPAERYARYKPAASLAFEQLLGRPLGEDEFKNYVSAAQGLGISKGPDFQAFLGETLLSSPEYRKRAVVFDPTKVASAISKFRTAPSMSEYASMIGLS
jgi:hypothetical protein